MKRQVALIVGTLACFSLCAGCGDDKTSFGSSAGAAGSGKAGSSGGGNGGAGAAGAGAAGSSNAGSSSGGAQSGDAGNQSGGGTHAGAGGSSASGGTGGADTGCPAGCQAPKPGATCPASQVYWTCFGTAADPTPSQQIVQEFNSNCTSKQTPQPTFCCPATFHSGC